MGKRQIGVTLPGQVGICFYQPALRQCRAPAQ